MNETEKIIKRVIGYRLTSVNFVLDYVILSFDHQGSFTALIWPELHINNEIVRFSDHGYRDKLCNFIGIAVQDLLYSQDERIELLFGNDLKLVIPLSDKGGQETALFSAPNNVLVVWN